MCLIRGIYRLARRAKPRELAKEQALRMFVGAKKSGKRVTEASSGALVASSRED